MIKLNEDQLFCLKLLGGGARQATGETWQTFRILKTAQLWEAMVLLCGLVPLSTSRTRAVKLHYVTWRADLAVRELDSGMLLSCGRDFEDPLRTQVSLASVREWAVSNLIGVPEGFPGGTECVEQASQGDLAIARAGSASGLAPSKVVKAELTEKPAKLKRDRPGLSGTPEFIRMADLLPLLNISKATLWRQVKTGKFPGSVKLSPSMTAWRRADVDVWGDELKSPVAKRRDWRN